MKYLPFLILLFLVVACNNVKTEKPVASNEPPVAITAVDLTKAYKENEIAADAKYKGKPLEVSGKISNIADVLGSIQVDLEGFKENGLNLVTVKCSFDESEKQAVAKLKNGQQATFQGTGDGQTANLYVGMNNCKIK